MCEVFRDVHRAIVNGFSDLLACWEWGLKGR